MTVIAWDGQTLSSDRQRTIGGTPTTMRKARKVTAPDGRQFLVGCCGRSDFIQMFLAWLAGGERPVFPVTEDFYALVIDQKRRLWVIHDTLIYVQVTGIPHWAIGSGGNYAIGAMQFGATSAEAVRVACRLDVNCGLGVDSVRFA